MIISIASGKGGTGKTTVAVSLALSLEEDFQLLDCDVKEPNSHIFIKPEIYKTEKVKIEVPEINLSKCDFCGKCGDFCAFNSILVFKEKVLVFKELCHSCGGCKLVCPKDAIVYKEKEIGFLNIGKFKGFEFINGVLNLKEPRSSPLIRKVKEKIDKRKTVLIDCPPGTSCPVIEAVLGSDFCILVTEPTPFGLNDLKITMEVLKKLKIPFGVVINRSNIGKKEMEDYLKKEKIHILMKIPFDEKIAYYYSKGIPPVEKDKNLKKEFSSMSKKLKEKFL